MELIIAFLVVCSLSAGRENSTITVSFFVNLLSIALICRATLTPFLTYHCHVCILAKIQVGRGSFFLNAKDCGGVPHSDFININTRWFILTGRGEQEKLTKSI